MVAANADASEIAAVRDEATGLLTDCGDGRVEFTDEALRLFPDFLQKFGRDENGELTPVAQKAFLKYGEAVEKRDPQTPQQNEGQDWQVQNDDDNQNLEPEFEKKRARTPFSDENQDMMYGVTIGIWADMGIITPEQRDNADTPEKRIELINSVKDLKGEQEIDFSYRLADRIVGNDELFSHIPPKALANAYKFLKTHPDKSNEKPILLERITERIDKLIDDFAINSGYWFADPTNIADVYAGYNYMFDVRSADLNQNNENDAKRLNAIIQNKARLEEYIADYDKLHGLDKLKEEDAAKLSQWWDNLKSRVDQIELSPETIKLASKYLFKDKDGNPIPQFIDQDGKPQTEYKDGYEIDPNGRLASVIGLARHDVVKDNLTQAETIEDEELESKLNDQVPYKLFEIDTAEKLVHGILEDPDRFTNPEHFNNFVNSLRETGGEISDQGYQLAMDVQVNQTGGWLGRVKQKLGKATNKVGGFFKKVFSPLEKIDKRAKDRLIDAETTPEEKRKKRIEYFLRILRGFGSAALVSATLTVIATAAAALTGVSLAVGMAVVGVITGMTVTAIQISKWRKEQESKGKPSDIHALLKDKRMLATIGTTGIAAIAMIFGAAGLQTAAMALGFGAMALGGGKNAISTYKDAKAANLSTKESIAWALANAAAVVAGGFAGRGLATHAINAYNQHNPENTLFQNKETHQEIIQEEHTETREEYTPEARASAEHIVKSWFQDNPAEMQRLLDAVSQYNAEHGTNIDPYRALMISADAGMRTFDNIPLHVNNGGVVYSHGNHTVLTDHWGAEHGFSHDELMSVRNLFNSDGTINPQGMDVLSRLDHIISDHNEVGYMTGRSVHTDGVLGFNDTENGQNVWTTYANGDSAHHTVQTTFVNDVPVDVPHYTPVDIPWIMGMFGNRFPKTDQDFKDLKERIGSKLDRIIMMQKAQGPDKPEPPKGPEQPEPPTGIIEDPAPKDPGEQEPPTGIIEDPAPKDPGEQEPPTGIIDGPVPEAPDKGAVKLPPRQKESLDYDYERAVKHLGTLKPGSQKYEEQQKKVDLLKRGVDALDALWLNRDDEDAKQELEEVKRILAEEYNKSGRKSARNVQNNADKQSLTPEEWARQIANNRMKKYLQLLNQDTSKMTKVERKKRNQKLKEIFNDWGKPGQDIIDAAIKLYNERVQTTEQNKASPKKQKAETQQKPKAKKTQVVEQQEPAKNNGPKYKYDTPKYANTPETAAFLADEYNVVHGAGAWDYLTPQQRNHYEQLVRSEFETDPGADKYDTFDEYLVQRSYYLDKAVELRQKTDNKSRQDLINEARTTMWKSTDGATDKTLEDLLVLIKDRKGNTLGEAIRMSQDPAKGHVVYHRKDKRFNNGKVANPDKVVSLQDGINKLKDKAKKSLYNLITFGGNSSSKE